MTDVATQLGEVRMLIDGKLVEAISGKRFQNINPANEEVLGEVADGGVEDMRLAIAAARRAFDTTDWSTNHAFRKKCLLQLHEAIVADGDALREELIAEVGSPRMLTYMAQFDMPLADGIKFPANLIDTFPWDKDLGEAAMMGMTSRRAIYKEAIGVIGAIVPWNYPFEVTVNKLAPC
jgi:aldehyde dehydrogenase (NAD+)